MKINFTSTVCDIEFVVEGEYSAPDPSTGTPRHFSVDKVWLPSDRLAKDLSLLMTPSQTERLQEEGKQCSRILGRTRWMT